MVDLFDEVEEELRTEQYKKLALKLAPWVLGGLAAGALVAAIVYGVIRYEASVTSKAASTYEAAMQTFNQGDMQGTYKQLDAVSSGAKGYKALALMVQGGIRLQDNKTAEAVKLFDQAAAVAPHNKSGLILADTARLKAVWALLDDSPYAEIETRLKPLTEEGRPLRAQAREALVMAMLDAGKTKEAREEAVRLTVAPDSTDAISQRATLVIKVIDSGDAAQIPAVVKQAKTTQPTPQAPQNMQITPEMLQQLRAQAGQGAAAAEQGPPGAGQ